LTPVTLHVSTIRPPPRSTLFPYTTLFRSRRTLLDLDKGKLTDEQSERRSELLEEVSAAINQSNRARQNLDDGDKAFDAHDDAARSEEHTSELQSLRHLVCRLLLEKKKTNT